MTITKSDCIESMQRAYRRNNKEPITRRDYDELRDESDPAASTVRNKFNNHWLEAADVAGIQTPGRGKRKDTEVRERQRRKVVIYVELKNRRSCNNCDENRPNVLCFHHDKPGNKSHSISQSIHGSLGVEEFVKEINKCSLLCANCHQDEHTEWPPNF